MSAVKSVCAHACMTWDASVLSLSFVLSSESSKPPYRSPSCLFTIPILSSVLFLLIVFKPCLYLWICWVHSYTSRISTLRLDCTNYTSKLGNWISYSASGLERENTGIIMTDRDTPTVWCHRHSGPVFPIDKSRFMMWPPWLFSSPKRFISFFSWETAIWG